MRRRGSRGVVEAGAALGTRGAALALLLLLISALSGLGTGVLTLARRQALASRTSARVLQARLAAESGLLGLVGRWPVGADSLPVGGQVSGPAHTFGEQATISTRVNRLSPELFLVHSVGRHTPSRAISRVAAAVWVLEPASRLSAQGAVVVSREGLSVLGGGRVDGADTHRVPSGWDSAWCDPLWPVVDSLFPTGEMRAFRAPGTGLHLPTWQGDGTLRPFEATSPGEGIGLGMIPLDTLAIVARPIGDAPGPDDSGCAVPVDASGLACGLAPGIWGGSGHLALSGGSARGVLAVDGDLQLGGATRFSGWIVTSGDVTLRDDALVEGIVRAGGSVRVEDRAVVAGAPCAALVGMESAWLRNPRKMPDFSHLGPLPGP
jgi:hypothetical protein